MDAYLDIAATILRTQKRPLSSHAILALAHQASLVPIGLYGKTQHNTLGARISEDIIKYRDNSKFFRTAPGRYFLREFLDDTTLPDEYRQPFPARRRIRELTRGPALAIPNQMLRSVLSGGRSIASRKVLKLLKEHRYAYLDPKKVGDAALIRSFVFVFRGSEVLSYRLGRYRDDRDTFLHKRSIGFTTLVHIDEHTLFNVNDMGIVEAGVRAVKIDLDIPPLPSEEDGLFGQAILREFLWTGDKYGKGDLLAIISYRCPQWFEPVKRRLALNNLQWIDASGINNIDDYDPWSRCVLEAHHDIKVFSSSVRD